MNKDGQVERFRAARVRHHDAQQAHRDAVHELEAASAQLTVAGAALAERALLSTNFAPLEGGASRAVSFARRDTTAGPARCREGAAAGPPAHPTTEDTR